MKMDNSEIRNPQSTIEDKVSILVVDDRPENLMALEAVLNDLDLNLVKAGSGEEALRQVLSQEFAMILLDVKMPGMDGFETATQIRKCKQSSKTPIIFVTAAYETKADISRGYSLGAVDYIIKPFSQDQISAKVKVYVDLFKQHTVLKKELQTIAEVEEKINILLVDDHPENLIAMAESLAVLGENLFSAHSGKKALSLILKHDFSLLIIDVNMPDMDGFELATLIKQRKQMSQVPIIFVSAIQQAMEDVSRGYSLGAVDYIFTPYEPDILRSKVGALVILVKSTKILSDHVKKIEKLNRTLAHSEGMLKDLNQTLEEKVKERTQSLAKSLDGIIQVLATIIEKRDPYTAGHQRRVANLARAIAQEMGFFEKQLEGIYVTGIIHDMGKIAIPSEILSKPIRLNEIEFNLIKTHPQIGYDIIKDIEFPWPIAEVMLQHHERMDGSGYPQGLLDKDILMEARILGVADVVEAMASHRPYRPALGIDKALEEISLNRGILYDADVADACLKVFTEKSFKFENKLGPKLSDFYNKTA